MASRRMFSAEITNEDKFTEMPATAQALYFHLGLKADDEGFVGSCKQVIRGLGFQIGDFEILSQEGYVIVFETGVIVITDWMTHNSIRKDRVKETRYQNEKAQLQQNEGKYILVSREKNHLATTCQPNDNQMSAQVRLGKVSIDKNNIPPISPKGEVSEQNGESLTVEMAGGTDKPSAHHSKTRNARKLSTEQTELFGRFWFAYPRKEKKNDAKNAFAKLETDEDLIQKMLDALAWQSKTEQWTRDNGRFVPLPTSWLNGKRWEDEAQVQNASFASQFNFQE